MKTISEIRRRIVEYEFKLTQLGEQERALGGTPKRRKTRRDECCLIIEKYATREFSTQDIIEQYQAVEYTPAFRSKISTILRSLAVDGFLVRTHLGRGGQPNRYRRANDVY